LEGVINSIDRSIWIIRSKLDLVLNDPWRRQVHKVKDIARILVISNDLIHVQLLNLQHTLNLNFYNPSGVQNLLLVQLLKENLVDHQLVEQRHHALSVFYSLPQTIFHQLLLTFLIRQILP
tara:strand:- start:3602 stop:3964 length:363 start_codon:yes stop_codon:yes gene_type:complete